MEEINSQILFSTNDVVWVEELYGGKAFQKYKWEITDPVQEVFLNRVFENWALTFVFIIKQNFRGSMVIQDATGNGSSNPAEWVWFSDGEISHNENRLADTKGNFSFQAPAGQESEFQGRYRICYNSFQRSLELSVEGTEGSFRISDVSPRVKICMRLMPLSEAIVMLESADFN